MPSEFGPYAEYDGWYNGADVVVGGSVAGCVVGAIVVVGDCVVVGATVVVGDCVIDCVVGDSVVVGVVVVVGVGVLVVVGGTVLVGDTVVVLGLYVYTLLSTCTPLLYPIVNWYDIGVVVVVGIFQYSAAGCTTTDRPLFWLL